MRSDFVSKYEEYANRGKIKELDALCKRHGHPIVRGPDRFDIMRRADAQ